MVVFCITCKGRLQHIERTLPKNLADNTGSDSKFVLLNYASPDNLLGYLAANHQQDIDSGKLAVYTFEGGSTFRMAHAKNMAHRLGMLEGGDLLVNLDADNFTGSNFDQYITEQFNSNSGIFLWARMIQQGENRLPRGISGRIAVSSHTFLNAGGYDEKYNTWGPDDKDFNARLQRLGYTPKEIDRQYLNAIHHPDKLRFKEYPEALSTVAEDSVAWELANTSSSTVVNYGKIGNGVVYRNFNPYDTVTLSDIPTRIFGIGMHKTATCSLHAALKTLGFDSAHWVSPGRAKAVWNEMLGGERSRTLEKHYAHSDLPITCLYRQLDTAYPNSKFILTTRNEDAWLRSVRNHWDPARNPFRGSWDRDYFTHRIHNELYGRKTFDAETFLAKYRRHNAEVKEYFKYRPADLLVMDMDANAGWPELCSFLGKATPSVEYPENLKPQKEQQMTDGITPLTPAQAAQQEEQVTKEGYVHKDLVGLDQFANVVTGGLPDETISSRLARSAEEGHEVGEIGSKILDVFQKDHGAKAVAGDLERADAVTAAENKSGIVE